MVTTSTGTRLTYEDYVLFPDDGRRHELIDGEHCVTPSPVTKHQAVSMALSLWIGAAVRERRLGLFFAAPFDVLLSESDVVQPDLLFVSNENAGIVTEKHVRGAPDLVVEVLSEHTRTLDEVIKLALYGSAGVREYWLVDPLLATVVIYRLVDGAFHRAAELTAAAGEAIESPLLPGLAIPLNQVFA